jgi:hypothetical protein
MALQRKADSEAPRDGARRRGREVRPYDGGANQLKNFTMRRIEETRASMSAGVLYT